MSLVFSYFKPWCNFWENYPLIIPCYIKTENSDCNLCFTLFSSAGMKTPLSPSQLLESGHIFGFGGMCQELMDTPTPTSISLSVPHATSSGDWHVKWSAAQYTSATKGKLCSFLLSSLLFFSGQSGTYSLCEVCNLQLTSAAQAQLHYNGRSHLRRVRQLQAGENRQQAAGNSLL